MATQKISWSTVLAIWLHTYSTLVRVYFVILTIGLTSSIFLTIMPDLQINEVTLMVQSLEALIFLKIGTVKVLFHIIEHKA